MSSGWAIESWTPPGRIWLASPKGIWIRQKLEYACSLYTPLPLFVKPVEPVNGAVLWGGGIDVSKCQGEPRNV
jgi:hypothetical protein